PVDRQLDDLAPEHAHALERRRVEEARARADRLAQRRRRRFLVHPDEAAPGVDAALDEAQVLLAPQLGRELLGEADVRVRGVERPRPAVEGAADAAPLEAAAARGEAAPAVPAGVLEGAQRAARVAHDEDRVAPDLVLDVVAGLAQSVLAAGDLPHARPEPL